MTAANSRVQEIKTARAFKPLLYPARYKGAHGGRGSGKSHFFAELMIEAAMVKPGLRAVCIREVQRSLEQSVKRLIEDKVQSFGWGKAFRCMDTEIRTRGNGLIIFQGMQNHTAESIKSLEGYDIAWVEEAQALSQRSLDLLRPTIRKPESELWFSWNPNQSTDPVDAFLRAESPPPDARVVGVSWRDNPWFPDVLRQEMEYDYRTDPDAAAHVWGGGYWSRTEAQVLSGKWSVDDFTPGADWHGPYYGADWGFSQDPTALIRFWLDPERSLYVEHEAWAVGVEMDELAQLFDTVPGSREHTIRADDSRPETISHVARAGFKIQAARKGKGSVEDGVSWLRSRPRIVIHPRCRRTAQEARLWSYRTDRLTNDPLPMMADGNDHTWDAIRYGAQPLIRVRTLRGL